MFRYRLKISKTNKFLFGNKTFPQNFDSPSLVLVIRVDDVPELTPEHPVKIFTFNHNANPPEQPPDQPLYKLEAGNTYIIRLSNLAAVYAMCDNDIETFITCTIMAESG